MRMKIKRHRSLVFVIILAAGYYSAYHMTGKRSGINDMTPQTGKSRDIDGLMGNYNKQNSSDHEHKLKILEEQRLKIMEDNAEGRLVAKSVSRVQNTPELKTMPSNTKLHCQRIARENFEGQVHIMSAILAKPDDITVQLMAYIRNLTLTSFFCRFDNQLSNITEAKLTVLIATEGFVIYFLHYIIFNSKYVIMYLN